MVSEHRKGPQPYEDILSVVCEAFHCLPSQAEQESWPLVSSILDCRLAHWAVETMNDRAGGMATMGRNPQLMEMLRDMIQAQTGADEAAVDGMIEGLRPAEDG